MLAIPEEFGSSFDPIVVCPRPECLDKLFKSAALEAREVEFEAGGPTFTAWVPPTAR